MEFSSFEIGVIVAGAVAGGFVNGLTGFGTALTAVPIWVLAVNPVTAAALAAAAGVAGQLQTLHLIRHAIVWRTAVPFIAAGLIGVPIGTWALPALDPRLFKLAVGLVMIVYCGFMLLVDRRAGRPPIPDDDAGGIGGRLQGLAVGFGGGVMGGLAGLSGPLPIAWMRFQPWSRDRKRGLLQAYNTAILSAMLISVVAAGLLPARFWTAFLIAVPGTLAGVQLGAWQFRRLDDRRFDRVVMALLLAMGTMLVAANIR